MPINHIIEEKTMKIIEAKKLANELHNNHDRLKH